MLPCTSVSKYVLMPSQDHLKNQNESDLHENVPVSTLDFHEYEWICTKIHFDTEAKG